MQHLIEALVEICRFLEASDIVGHEISAFLFSEMTAIVLLTLLNSSDLVLIEPFNSFAVFPESISCWLAILRIFTYSVLFATGPVSIIFAAICPLVIAVTMLLIVFVFTLVGSAVGPFVLAHAFHVIIEPHSLVLPTVFPFVETCTLDQVFVPLTVVSTSVCPLVETSPMLLSFIVFSTVN